MNWTEVSVNVKFRITCGKYKLLIMRWNTNILFHNMRMFKLFNGNKDQIELPKNTQPMCGTTVMWCFNV